MVDLRGRLLLRVPLLQRHVEACEEEADKDQDGNAEEEQVHRDHNLP